MSECDEVVGYAYSDVGPELRLGCDGHAVAEVDAYAPSSCFGLPGCGCGMGDCGGAWAVAADPCFVVGAGVVALLDGKADVDGVGDADGIGADGAGVPVRRDWDWYGDGADGVGGLRAGQGYVYGVADDEGVGEGMDFRRQLSLGCVPAQDQGCGKCQAQDGEDGGEGSVCCCSHSSGLLG